MQEVGHSYPEPLCFQVKAAKELEENSNKIDSLLSWVASLEQKGGLPEYRPHPVNQGTGTQAGKSTGDVPDGHVVGADSAAESLDEQYERLKVSTDSSSHPKPPAPCPAPGVRWVWPLKYLIFHVGGSGRPCLASCRRCRMCGGFVPWQGVIRVQKVPMMATEGVTLLWAQLL